MFLPIGVDGRKYQSTSCSFSYTNARPACMEYISCVSASATLSMIVKVCLVLFVGLQPLGARAIIAHVAHENDKDGAVTG